MQARLQAVRSVWVYDYYSYYHCACHQFLSSDFFLFCSVRMWKPLQLLKIKFYDRHEKFFIFVCFILNNLYRDKKKMIIKWIQNSYLLLRSSCKVFEWTNGNSCKAQAEAPFRCCEIKMYSCRRIFGNIAFDSVTSMMFVWILWCDIYVFFCNFLNQVKISLCNSISFFCWSER